MWKTVVRRILIMIPQIILLSLLVFIVANFMPGDPFTGLIDPNMDAKQIEQMREAAGLNDPLPVRYLTGSPMPCKETLDEVLPTGYRSLPLLVSGPPTPFDWGLYRSSSPT